MKPNRSLRRFLAVAASSLLAIPCADAQSTLYWDANAATALQTDGLGAWLAANQWWNGSTNTTWASGDSAVFGYSGAGGAVTLAGTTTIGSLVFNPFTGTYTLGTTGAGNTITLNNGITHNSGGTATILSPLILGGAQTWTNNSGLNITGTASPGSLVVGSSTAGIDNGGNLLTIDGIGTTQTGGVLSGAGGLTKNGTGTLILSGPGTPPLHTYTGTTTINGGVVRINGSTFNNSTGTGNITINSGVLEGYFGGSFTRALGSGAGQIQILGGTSGFSGQGGSNTTFNLGGAGAALVWGSTFFNPTQFVLQSATANANGIMTLTNGIDLGGATRTIASLGGNTTGGATVAGAVTNGGLTKIGVGNLILGNAGNNYSGATTINGGTITLSGSGAITATSALNLGGGTLRLVNTANTQRFADVAVSATAGGGVTYENTSGAVNYTESLGALTLTKGQVNVVLTTDQVSTGSQKLTFGTAGTGNLTQGVGGKGVITFSAAGAGLNATKNTVAVFGATASGAGGIIGPWATIGTAANVQTAYAAYDSSGFVVAATPTVATVDTDLSSSTGNYDINTGSLFTLAATRTVNAVQFRGAASTLDLATFKLETYGLFFSGGTANAKTISGTGALTTPSGGGNLYITAGQVMTATNEHRIGVAITDNSGTVNLVKSGAGILRLNGVNTFTGAIDINAGTLQIGTNGTANGAKLGGATGIYAGNIFIGAGANLDFQTDADQTLSGIISGDGNLLKRYVGTLTLSGANTYTGKTTIGAITNANSPTLVVSSFNSVVGGTASSSLGAPTTVANGTIEMGSNNSTPNPTLRYAGAAATGETTDRIINFTFNSSATRTLDASGSGLLKFTSPFTSTGLSTGQLALTGTGAGEIAGLPFLFNNLTKSGLGTWTLAGPSGSIGSVSVSAGTLVATDPRALGAAIGNLATTGPTISGTGTLSLRNNNSVTFGVAGTGYNINNSASGATINVDRVSGTGSNTLAVGNLTTTSTAGSWQLNFTGANGVSLNAGALTAPLSTTATTHTISNDIATTNNAALTLAGISAPSTNAAPVLNFTGTGHTIVTGNITQTTTALALTKNGNGKVTLNGSASYTGTTTVSAGVLAVNGSLANTSTTVSGTGRLQGSGSTVGSVTINSGGTLAAGNSIESLKTGALTLNANSTFAYEIDNDAVAANAGDLTAVTGDLTIDLTNAAILTIGELGNGTWIVGEKLTLISYSGNWNGGLFNYGGTLADDSNFMFSGMTWLFNYNDGSAGTNYTGDLTGSSFVTMTVVPEPRAALLGGLGLLVLLRRRRK